MKVTLESTTRLVDVRRNLTEEVSRALNAASLVMESDSFRRLREAVNGISVPARVWEGKTESGIYVVGLITRIAHHKRDDAHAQQFAEELQACADPSADAMQAFPARLIL
jgi:hypothetical protein